MPQTEEAPNHTPAYTPFRATEPSKSASSPVQDRPLRHEDRPGISRTVLQHCLTCRLLAFAPAAPSTRSLSPTSPPTERPSGYREDFLLFGRFQEFEYLYLPYLTYLPYLPT